MAINLGDEPATVGDYVVVVETDRAILCKEDEMDDDGIWVPKSVVHDDSEIREEGDQGTLVVKQWFADREGL